MTGLCCATVGFATSAIVAAAPAAAKNLRRLIAFATSFWLYRSLPGSPGTNLH
ncbi:MAG: hypothetical protein WBG18_07645 [Xanthobacteraceae bacterium]